jgi:hypothetical protein
MTDIATSGIVQQAFRLMEMSPPSSLGDGSEAAQAAAEQYPVALEIGLEHCDWSFASKPADLAAVDEASGDPNLPNVYARPTDLLHIREVWPQDANWRIDADRIRSDCAAPFHVRYTARVSDEDRMPAIFRTAVAYQLASLLAPRWTTSINRAGELGKAAAVWLRRAARADGRSASGHRADGLARQGDWASMAVAPYLGRFQ